MHLPCISNPHRVTRALGVPAAHQVQVHLPEHRVLGVPRGMLLCMLLVLVHVAADRCRALHAATPVSGAAAPVR